MDARKLNDIASLFNENYCVLDTRIAKTVYEDNIEDEKYVFIIRDGYANLYSQDVQTFKVNNNVCRYTRTKKAIYIEIENDQDVDALINDDFLLANIIYGEETVMKKVSENSKRQLCNALTKSLQIDKNNTLQKIQQYEDAIKQYFVNISRTCKEIDVLRGRLHQDAEISNILEKAEKEIDKILKHKDVEKVYFLNNCLHIKTKDVYITEHYSKRRYYLGKMLIKINITNNSVEFENTNNKRNDTYWSGEANHPHVDRSGHPCLGNIDAQICQFLTEKEYYATFITALNYLQQADIEDSAGHYVCIWDEVDEDGNIINAGHKPKYNEYGNEEDGNDVHCCICGGRFYIDDTYVCEDCGRRVCDECSFEEYDMILCEDCFAERRSEEE